MNEIKIPPFTRCAFETNFRRHTSNFHLLQGTNNAYHKSHSFPNVLKRPLAGWKSLLLTPLPMKAGFSRKTLAELEQSATVAVFTSTAIEISKQTDTNWSNRNGSTKDSFSSNWTCAFRSKQTGAPFTFSHHNSQVRLCEHVIPNTCTQEKYDTLMCE